MRRLALAGALVCAASAAVAAEPAPQAPAAAPVELMAYVSGFCVPIAINDADPTAFAQLLSSWKARAAGGEAGDWTPQDANVPGQQFLFEQKDAPRAFVERRRSGCALVYPGAKAPADLTAEFKSVSLPVGDANELHPWRRMVIRRAGPPPPTRWFLAVGSTGSVGLCATIFEDLRLRDNAPVTLVKVATCRLSGDETFDNG